MCGIFGAIGNIHGVDKRLVHQLLSHRGPDDSGEFIDENLLFLHWRLSIQDLSPLGHQPMISMDGRYVLIFNGEIYNHWTIRNLISSKYIFKSNSDTETILYGFVEYGIEILSMLNGIFSLALYDLVSKEITIARDQMGVKPLYYSFDSKQFLFASESKAIVPFLQSNLSIDSNALMNYLQLLWSPDSNTLYNEVKKLPAGNYIRIKLDDIHNFSVNKYYEIPFGHSQEIKEYRYWQDELEEKLLDAVERQVLSDVPVGFFLSGGLDSSLLVAIYKKLFPNKKIKAYTISTGKEFEEEGFSDDLSYALKVADYLDVDLTVCESKINILNDFDRMIYQLDEPQADLAPLHVESICRKAREEGFLVLLSGAGGDDLFSGYRRHELITQHKRIQYVPFVKELLRFVQWFSHDSTRRRIDRYLDASQSKSLIQTLANSFAWLSSDKVKGLLESKQSIDLNGYEPSHFLLDSLNNISEEKDILNQCLYWDMKYFLPDHNLNYTDKLSMSQAVEVRVPYLDLDLVEFSTRLPVEYKLNGTTTKYILRKLAEKYLPHEVIYRSKTGFGAPIRTWMKGELDQWVNNRLTKESIEQFNLFNKNEIDKLINDNRQGTIDASYTILSILAIQSYLNQTNYLKK